MSARDVDPGELERYRLALEAAIARTSLRTVAAAIGMSPTGLSEFIAGTRPYARTVERVRRWYQRYAGLDAVQSEEIAADLRRIVGTLPDPDNGVANLLEAVERSYRSAGLAPPDWVEQVRRGIGARAAPRSGPGAAAVLLSRDTA
jgi:hypothetical protein